MSQQQKSQLYPLLSVIIIIVSLFTLVFLQMEVRRMGYALLKQTREYKNLQDQHRMNIMRHAKVMRPERLRDLAVQRLTLNEAKSGQIIHMSGEKIAIRQ
jgi:cell division protein FtsL